MTNCAYHRRFAGGNRPHQIRVIKLKEILKTPTAPAENNHINCSVKDLQGGNNPGVGPVTLNGSRRQNDLNRKAPGNNLLNITAGGTSW